MPVEEVERLMQENQDAADWQRQVNDLIGGSLSAEDDELAMQELAALEEEVSTSCVALHLFRDVEEGLWGLPWPLYLCLRSNV